jgi:diguanylate cyclase
LFKRDPRLGARILWTLCVVLLLGLTVLAVSVVPGVRRHPGYNPVLDAGLDSLLYVLAAVIVAVRAIVRRRDRLAWAVLATGMGCYASANLYYYLFQVNLAVVPIPSPADGLYLLFYPAVYVFIILKMRRAIVGSRSGIWLDGMAAALGASALAAAFVFDFVITDTNGSAATVATNLAYPTGDLILFAVIVGSFGVFGWRPGPIWWFAGIGMGLFAFADIVYLFEASHNSYQAGTWLDVSWGFGLALLALAAVWRENAASPRSPYGQTMSGVPLVFAVTSVGLLVVATRIHVASVAIVLAAATLLAAVLRTWLTFRDVRHLADTRRLARTDDLTGLPNRRHFHAAVTDATTGSHPAECAVLMMDLDRFKEINDSLGHSVGDQLLGLLGPRLVDVLSHGEVLARLGGDEFGILLPGAGAIRAAVVATELLSSLRKPFELAGVSLHVDASIGIALYPDHAHDVGRLLQCADIAMYRAKNAHSGSEFSDPAVDSTDRQRLETIEALRLALDADELILHYQPKLNLATGTVDGVEALVRWQHPTRGLLFPDTFIPLAEQAGLMRRLTLAVLEIALRQVNAWRKDGRNLTVAVNLSASNLLDSHLPEQIDLILQTLNLPSYRLEVEITETVLMADPIRAQHVLLALKRLGIRIAVDDYGTGYSALAYLHDLPIDDLKLDRSFVMRSATDARSAAIVHSTIGLAHSLGMKIIAEGVETAEALHRLANAGCDVAQGYYLSRPQPAHLLTRWLDEHSDPVLSRD